MNSNTDVLKLKENIDNYLKNKEFDLYFESLFTIIQYYIDNDNLDEALIYCNKMDENIDKVNYKDNYKRLLDFYVYIYIHKQFYERALSYSSIKMNYIDVTNQKEINRWYLERSYIYEAVNDSIQAFRQLEIILNNDPEDYIKSIALENIIKLYIDNNDLYNAQIRLDESMEFALKINDQEGLDYCTFLQSKIYRLKEQYDLAFKTIKSLKINDNLDELNFSYLNEYINLCIDSERYNDGINIASKYYESVKNSKDFENMLLFYKNYLRLSLTINPRQVKQRLFINSFEIFDKINDLELTINNNKAVESSKIREDEIQLELRLNEERGYNAFNDIVNYIKFNENSTLRDFIFDYFSSLSFKFTLADATLVLFGKLTKELIKTDNKKSDEISTYQFKNNRLYERNCEFSLINNTLVEKLIDAPVDFITFDINNSSVDYNDLLQTKLYKELNYKFVICMPIYDNNELVGATLINLFNNDLNNTKSLTEIKLINKLFGVNLLKYLNKVSFDNQEGIINATVNNLNIASFYQIIDGKNKLHLSDKLKKMLGVNDEILSEVVYVSNLNPTDYDKYLTKYDYFEKKVPYRITYHYEIDGKEYLFSEQASPYINKNNELYYCGTIEKVIIDSELSNEVINANEGLILLDFEQLNIRLENLKKSSFTGFAFKSNDNKNKVFDKLKKVFNEKVYNDDNLFVVIVPFKELKSREANKLVKECNDIDFISYTFINYPSQLLRISDFIEISQFLLNNDGYVEFNNENYASFISYNTVTNCVLKAINTNTVEVAFNKLTINNINGLYLIPSITGVYGVNSIYQLKKKLINDLDVALLKKLKCIETNDLIVKNINISSLYNVLLNKELESVLDNENLVFMINDLETNGNLFNDVLKKISKTKSKIIINESNLKCLSLNSLKYYSNVIVGYVGDNNDCLNVLDQYNKNYLKISKDSIKISNDIVKIK